MNTAFTSYALLGSGRVARHLHFYIQSLNLPVKVWSRRSAPLSELSAVAEGCSHVLLAVKDDAIEELSRPLIAAGRTLVHFSGALQVSGVSSAHPLMTFGSQLETLDWYLRIPFVIDQGHSMVELLPGFPNQGWPLDPKLRPLYHALTSLAGNSTFLLWQSVGREFEKMGLPRTVLQAFLHQTVTNSALPTPAEFTGPVARGDWNTVQMHLEALKIQPDLLASYRNYLELARGTGHNIPEAIV